MKTANQVTFGVEIECGLPSHIGLEQGSYHHGEQIQGFPRGWNGQRDGSVHAGDGLQNVEIVSGILSGEQGLTEVVAVLDWIYQVGGAVNNSCGLHVHIGTDGLTSDQVRRVVTLFKKFEVAFYDLNGTKARARYQNGYCKPSSQWDGGRYASLNLQHVNDGHLEIRVWAGALDAAVVVAAIQMAVSLVARASDPEPVKTSHIGQLDKVGVMQDYIGQFMSKPEYLIVPDVTPEDIYAVMIEQASLSNR